VDLLRIKPRDQLKMLREVLACSLGLSEGIGRDEGDVDMRLVEQERDIGFTRVSQHRQDAERLARAEEACHVGSEQGLGCRGRSCREPEPVSPRLLRDGFGPASLRASARKNAEQGDAQSQHNLAVLYIQGLGVPKNKKEAAGWMRKSAEQGLAAGQVGMGALYENGDGVPPDPVEAVNWYRLAVAQNDASAMNNLALLLATSNNPHVRNPQEAVTLASKAVAAANNPDYLDTLAAAYFANGQTDKAVETEKKALLMSPGNDSYKEALQKYMAANGGR